jgi:transcriptional regulator with XRE-family HTH domain
MPRPRKLSPDPDFLSRLRELSAKLGSYSALAKRAGLSPTTLQNYFEGGEPTRPALIALAAAGDVSVQWLCLGRGPKTASLIPEDYYEIPFFDLRASGWRIYPLSGSPARFLLFRRDWLDLPGVDIHQLESIEADEDLEPIVAGDLLVVDRSKGWHPYPRLRESGLESGALNLMEGAVYVVAREARVSLARLSWAVPGKSLLVTSPKIQAEEMPTEGLGYLILGTVVWHGGATLAYHKRESIPHAK